MEKTVLERPPTKKQLAYIRMLARSTNTSLYLGNIKTIEEASKTIDTLKQKRESLYQQTSNSKEAYKRNY